MGWWHNCLEQIFGYTVKSIKIKFLDTLSTKKVEKALKFSQKKEVMKENDAMQLG